MTVRDEITALIDELPESSLRIAKSLLLQSKADDRFRREALRRGRNRRPVGGERDYENVSVSIHGNTSLNRRYQVIGIIIEWPKRNCSSSMFGSVR